MTPQSSMMSCSSEAGLTGLAVLRSAVRLAGLLGVLLCV